MKPKYITLRIPYLRGVTLEFSKYVLQVIYQRLLFLELMSSVFVLLILLLKYNSSLNVFICCFLKTSFIYQVFFFKNNLVPAPKELREVMMLWDHGYIEDVHRVLGWVYPGNASLKGRMSWRSDKVWFGDCFPVS